MTSRKSRPLRVEFCHWPKLNKIVNQLYGNLYKLVIMRKKQCHAYGIAFVDDICTGHAYLRTDSFPAYPMSVRLRVDCSNSDLNRLFFGSYLPFMKVLSFNQQLELDSCNKMIYAVVTLLTNTVTLIITLRVVYISLHSASASQYLLGSTATSIELEVRHANFGSTSEHFQSCAWTE